MMKKLIAILCATMISTSTIPSVSAITYAGGNSQTEKQKVNVQNLNATISNCKSKLQEIKGKIQSNFAQNENYYKDFPAHVLPKSKKFFDPKWVQTIIDAI